MHKQRKHLLDVILELHRARLEEGSVQGLLPASK